MVLLTMTENLRMFEALVRVETRLWNQLDGTLSDRYGLSLAWLVALRVLQAEPGSRVQDLAEEIDISPGGASKVVDRLVSAGLVERAADDADRRVSRLSLTPRGRRVVQQGSKLSEEWLSERFGQALGPHGTEDLASLLGSLAVRNDARTVPHERSHT
ncbi:MAG TPA: MarR family transcriptional regulator [Dermatophilaceae bacterium]|nr:MarR family transcriptional regulator [Dermatophilaceae bacterium]